MYGVTMQLHRYETHHRVARGKHKNPFVRVYAIAPQKLVPPTVRRSGAPVWVKAPLGDVKPIKAECLAGFTECQILCQKRGALGQLKYVELSTTNLQRLPKKKRKRNN